MRVAFTLLLLIALFLTGCFAGYGTITSNPNAANVLADTETMARYTLYVYGNPEAPTAVAGLLEPYRMKGRVWQEVPAGKAGPVRPSKKGGRQGFDIRSDEDQTVGFLASSIPSYTVKVDTEGKVVELIPIVRVGGGK
jgi:hypothetical protein